MRGMAPQDWGSTVKGKINMMKKLIAFSVAVFGAVGLAFSASVDISGKTQEIGAGTADELTATSDATIKLVGTGTGTFQTGFHLNASGCVVTIDASALSGYDGVWLTDDLVNRGDGAKIRIVGVSSLRVGDTWTSHSGDGTNFPLCDAAFEFDGGDGSIVFVNGVTIWRDPGCAFSFAEGSSIAVAADGLLGDPTDGLVVEGYDLFILDTEGVVSVKGPRVTVKDGSMLVFKPCKVVYTAGNGYGWSGTSGTLTKDVVVEAGARFYIPIRQSNLPITGRISGRGEIAVGDYPGGPDFQGDGSSFAGSFVKAGSQGAMTVSGRLSCGSFTWSEDCSNAVSVPKDGVLSIGTLNSLISVSGEGSVTVAALADGASARLSAALTTEVRDADALAFNSASVKVFVKRAAQVDCYDLDGLEDMLGDASSYSLVAKDGFRYANVPKNVRLSVADNVTATLLSADVTNETLVAEGGNLTVADDPTFWRNNVLKWIDPSVADSLTGNTNGNADVVRTRNEAPTTLAWYGGSAVKYEVLHTITDCRPDRRSWALACDKAYGAPANDIHPLAITNGLNGRTFLSFSGSVSRRTFHFERTPEQLRADGKDITPNIGAFNPKFAVLVFGSQGGGGWSMFSSADKYFDRGTGMENANRFNKDYPIFANAIPTWRNGVSIDPTTTNHSGEWDVFSIDCSGAPKGMTGIGTRSGTGSSTEGGGQMYGEILFFDKVLTDAERQSAERYLAAKWGLMDSYLGPKNVAAAVRAEGVGAIAFATDVQMEGSFAGALTLNGKRLSVSDLPVPPGEEVVTAASPAHWFDPDYPGCLTANARKELTAFYDRLLPMPKDQLEDDDLYLGSCGREPQVVCGSRGGAATNWISQIGRIANLRFHKKVDVAETKVQNPVSCQTIFLVQDSAYGGGTPFTREGFPSRITRAKGEEATGLERFVPIWSAWAYNTGYTYNVLRDPATATTYLDGRPVDGTVSGFGGKPEVFSVLSDNAFELTAFGDRYYNFNKEPFPPDCGEVQAECIMFDRRISEEERRKIEGYLAWKWLGAVHDGYSSLRGATLTGTGTVVVPEDRPMPQFGADFTGTASFAANRFAFTVTDANPEVPVTGLLDVGGGTFAPQSPCTLVVTVADGVKLVSGAFYPLVKGSVADGVELTLNIAADAKGRELKLESREGVLGLSVGRTGLLLLIK